MKKKLTLETAKAVGRKKLQALAGSSPEINNEASTGGFTGGSLSSASRPKQSLLSNAGPGVSMSGRLKDSGKDERSFSEPMTGSERRDRGIINSTPKVTLPTVSAEKTEADFAEFLKNREPMTGSEMRDRGRIESAEKPDEGKSFLQRLGDVLGHAAEMSAAADMAIYGGKTGQAEFQRRTDESIKKAADAAPDVAYVGERAAVGAADAAEGMVNLLGYAGQMMDRQKQAEAGQSIAAVGGLTGNKDFQKTGLNMVKENVTPGNKSLTDVAKFGDKYRANVESRYENVSDGARVAGDISEGVGGMVPAILANFIAPGSSLYVMAAGAAGNATQEAKAAGKDDARAMLYGVAVGATEALIEKAFDGVSHVFGKGAADDMIESVVKSAVKNEVAQTAIIKLMGVLGEGVEEFATEFADRLINEVTIDTDDRNFSETLGDAGYSLLMGMAVSGIIQTAGSVTSGLKYDPKTLAQQAADNVKAELENAGAEENAAPGAGVEVDADIAENTTEAQPDNDNTVRNALIEQGMSEEKADSILPTLMRVIKGDTTLSNNELVKGLPLADVRVKAVVNQLTGSEIDMKETSLGTLKPMYRAAIEAAAQQQSAVTAVDENLEAGTEIEAQTDMNVTASETPAEGEILAQNGILESQAATESKMYETGYTEAQAQNIRKEGGTFRNLVAGFDTSITNFFRKWREGRKSHQGEKLEKLYLGALTPDTLNKVSNILGYEVRARDVIITNDDAKHIYDKHPELEDWVFESLPSVVAAPDSVEKGHEGTGKNAGKTGVIMKKTMPNDTVVTIQFDNPGRGTLQVTAIYTKESTPSMVTDESVTRTPKATEPVLSNTGDERLTDANSPVFTADTDNVLPSAERSISQADTESKPLDEQAIRREKTMQAFKSKQQTPIEKAVEIGKKLGVEVRAEKLDNGVQGQYKNGVIRIDPDGTEPVRQVLVHELTHHIESSGLYQEFSDSISKYISENMQVDIESMKRFIIEEYAEGGIELDDDGAMREVVAKFCEDKLFTDEDAINRLAHTDRNLFQKIYYWIRDTVAKIGADAETRFLIGAQRLYEKALLFTGEAQSETEHLYAGERAKNADLRALSEAQDMERAGSNSETIRQKTGWFRGADDKWRFEIDDSGMEFRKDGDAGLMQEPGYQRLQELTDKWAASFEEGAELSTEETAELERLQEEYTDWIWEDKYMLTDFVKHDELFAQYPRLRGVSLIFDDLPGGTRGYFSKRSNTIVLSNALFGKDTDTVIHEIQHVIQKIEGFAGGSSPEYWRGRMEDGYSRKWNTGEEMMPTELYENTAGEIEARDAAKRREYTAQQRRETAPDTGDEDTVFADGGVSYSVGETDAGIPVSIVDSDILSNIDTNTWDDTKKAQAKRSAKEALLAFKDGVQVNGITYKVNRTTRREYTRSNDTERLYGKNKDAFADKMRAAGNADDIIIATTSWAQDGSLKHPRNDNFVDFVHGKVLMQAGSNQYEATTVVGITDNGEYVFYDVVDMTPTTFEMKKEPPTTASGTEAIGDIQGSSSIGTISNETRNVKRNSYGSSFDELVAKAQAKKAADEERTRRTMELFKPKQTEPEAVNTAPSAEPMSQRDKFMQDTVRRMMGMDVQQAPTEKAVEIGKKLGVEVRFDELGESIHGRYENGVITINSASEKPVVRVFVHELTHHMETSGMYQQFSEKILNYISESMEVDIDATKQDIIDEYAKDNIILDDDAASRELVAEFCESKLFTDGKAVDRLAHTDRNLFQKIYDWICDTLAKVGASEETKFLIDAQRMYERALRSTGRSDRTNTSYSLAEKKIPTYDELVNKPDMAVIDIRASDGDFKTRQANLKEKASGAAAPIVNLDTQEKVFVTKGTFSHSFSNNESERTAAAENIEKIIENAVLTHAEPSYKKGDNSTGVYTFFGAVFTDDGIKPVKLKVKEYHVSGQSLPAQVKTYMEESGELDTYASAYDARVLVLEEIEKEDTSSSAVTMPSATDGVNHPSVPSTVKVADLISLVNSEYRRYLPSNNSGSHSRGSSFEERVERVKAKKAADEARDKYAYEVFRRKDNVGKEQSAPADDGLGAMNADAVGETLDYEDWKEQGGETHEVSGEQAGNVRRQQGRDAEHIPVRNTFGRLTNKQAQTLINSGITTDSMAESLKSALANGAFSRMAYRDKSAMDHAGRVIERGGWEKALGQYQSDVRAGKVSKDITAMGIALYNNAVSNGDNYTAMDIAASMISNASSAAQALQASRMLNKLTPEGRLYMAVQSVENIQQELYERYGEDAPELEIDSGLLYEYRDALAGGDDAEIRRAWSDIEQNIADQMPATWYEKANTWRYLAMLGNPRTHIRNIVGNAGFAPVRLVKQMTGAALERVVLGKTGQGSERTKAILNPASANDRALIQAAWLDFSNVEDVVLGGGKYNDSQGSIQDKRTIYKTKPLEAVRKANSKALDAEDKIFSRASYTEALASYMKAQGIDSGDYLNGNITEEARQKAQEYAISEAQKATYRDINQFSEFVSKIGRIGRGKNASTVSKAAGVVAEGVLPFKKTPANILVRAVEYSPLEFGAVLAHDMRAVKKGDMSTADMLDHIASGLTGTGLVALGGLLRSLGWISGGADDDEKQAEFNELRGQQEYAITIGDKNFTLDWLAPAALPMFVGVELYDAFAEREEEGSAFSNFINALPNIAEPMLNMSMLSSVNDLISNVSYVDEGSQLWTLLGQTAVSYMQQYMPTLFGQIERVTENERETTFIDRDSEIGNDAQYNIGKSLNKLPGEFSQVPYIDAWGRTEDSGNIVERIANNMFNPSYVSEDASTVNDDELQRLYDLGYTDVFPTRAAQSTKVDGGYMNADEYVAYATARGSKSLEYVTALIQSEAYAKLSDDAKAKAVADAYESAKDEATAMVRAMRGGEGESSDFQAAADAGMDAGTYFLVQGAISTAAKPEGYTTQPAWNKNEIIMSLDISEEDKLAAIKMNHEGSSIADKIQTAYDKGVSLEQIVAYYSILQMKDEDGKSLDKDERKAAAKEKGVTKFATLEGIFK